MPLTASQRKRKRRGDPERERMIIFNKRRLHIDNVKIFKKNVRVGGLVRTKASTPSAKVSHKLHMNGPTKARSLFSNLN